MMSRQLRWGLTYWVNVKPDVSQLVLRHESAERGEEGLGEVDHLQVAAVLCTTRY